MVKITKNKCILKFSVGSSAVKITPKLRLVSNLL